MDFLYLISHKCLWKTRPVRFFTRLNFNFHSDRVERREVCMMMGAEWIISPSLSSPLWCWKTRLISSKIHFFWVSWLFPAVCCHKMKGEYESIGSVSWNKHGSKKGLTCMPFNNPSASIIYDFRHPECRSLPPDQSFSNWGHQINSAYLNLSPPPLRHTLATSANFSKESIKCSTYASISISRFFSSLHKFTNNQAKLHWFLTLFSVG